MRILITSGGTKVPIDPVRSITNHSTGKFGADIARAALKAQADVIYLTSKEGLSPFSKTIDVYSKKNSFEETLEEMNTLHAFHQQFKDHYIEYRYGNYAEYSVLLKQIMLDHRPDVVILAAAVSDYLIENYSSNKIHSSNQLKLQLKHAPKLIRDIKTWLPTTFLVGFKLLVNATEPELIQAGVQSVSANQADMIVVNDLTTLQKGAHEIFLVKSDGTFKKITTRLAEAIVTEIMAQY